MFKEYFNVKFKNIIYTFIFYRHTNDNTFTREYIFNTHLKNINDMNRNCVNALIYDYVTKIEIAKNNLSFKVNHLIDLNLIIPIFEKNSEDICFLVDESFHDFIENNINMKLDEHYNTHGYKSPPEFLIHEKDRAYVLTNELENNLVYFVKVCNNKIKSYYDIINKLESSKISLNILQFSFNDPNHKNNIEFYQAYRRCENTLDEIKQEIYGSDKEFFNKFQFNIVDNDIINISKNDEYVIETYTDKCILSTYLCKNISRLTHKLHKLLELHNINLVDTELISLCKDKIFNDLISCINISDGDNVYTFIFHINNFDKMPERLDMETMRKYLIDIELSYCYSIDEYKTTYCEIIRNLVDYNIFKIETLINPLESFYGYIYDNEGKSHRLKHAIKIINEKINPMLEILLK